MRAREERPSTTEKPWLQAQSRAQEAGLRCVGPRRQGELWGGVTALSACLELEPDFADARLQRVEAAPVEGAAGLKEDKVIMR